MPKKKPAAKLDAVRQRLHAILTDIWEQNTTTSERIDALEALLRAANWGTLDVRAIHAVFDAILRPTHEWYANNKPDAAELADDMDRMTGVLAAAQREHEANCLCCRRGLSEASHA